VLLCPDPAAHQVVPHGVGQRKVVIPLGGHDAILHQREVEVAVEVGLQLRHVLHAGQATHRDLLLAIMVGQRLGHGGGGGGAAAATGDTVVLFASVPALRGRGEHTLQMMGSQGGCKRTPRGICGAHRHTA